VWHPLSCATVCRRRLSGMALSTIAAVQTT
jgi:hypothetical protein